jgi:hypothetical protein
MSADCRSDLGAGKGSRSRSGLAAVSLEGLSAGALAGNASDENVSNTAAQTALTLKRMGESLGIAGRMIVCREFVILYGL